MVSGTSEFSIQTHLPGPKSNAIRRTVTDGRFVIPEIRTSLPNFASILPPPLQSSADIQPGRARTNPTKTAAKGELNSQSIMAACISSGDGFERPRGPGLKRACGI